MLQVVRAHLRHAGNVRAARLRCGIHRTLVREDCRLPQERIPGRRRLLAHRLRGVEEVFRRGQVVAERPKERAGEEPFVREAFRASGEVFLKDRGIFFRNRRERRVAMEVLDRVAVLDEGEILAFVEACRRP